MCIQQPPLLDEAKVALARKAQAKTISHARFSGEICCAFQPMDVDTMQLRAAATVLSGGWDVKVARAGMTRNRTNVAYFFRAGRVANTSPTMVVVHDVVSQLQELQTEVLTCAGPSEVVGVIYVLI